MNRAVSAKNILLDAGIRRVVDAKHRERTLRNVGVRLSNQHHLIRGTLRSCVLRRRYRAVDGRSGGVDELQRTCPKPLGF